MKHSLIILAILAICVYPDSASSREGWGESRVDDMDTPVPGRFIGPGGTQPYSGLTDAMHGKFMQNEEYAEADGLLNGTWQACKASMPQEEFRLLQEDQRRWLNGLRDSEAAKLADRMSLVTAYATVIRDRAERLAARIAVKPRSGEYEAGFGGFLASVAGDNVVIEGNASWEQNTCEFDGHGRISSGWIRMRHSDFPDYFLLFTKKGARIYSPASGMAQGCGYNVSFDGEYRFARK